MHICENRLAKRSINAKVVENVKSDKTVNNGSKGVNNGLLTGYGNLH